MPKHAIAGAAAILLATAPAAWAELDAQTLWADWQELYARFGGTITAASEDYSDGTLTLEDVTVASEVGPATSSGEYGTITMVEEADGSVSIRLPATLETTSTSRFEGVTQTQDMTMTSDGLDVVAREVDGIRTYDMTAASLSIVSDGATMVVEDEETDDGETAGGGGGDDMTTPGFDITLTGITSQYRSGVGGDEDAFEQDMSAESLSLTAEAEEAEAFRMAYEMSGTEAAFTGNYGEAPTGPVRGLSDMNVTYEGEMTHSGSTLTVSGDDGTGPFAVDGAADAGTLSLDLTEESLGYAFGSTDGRIEAQLPNFPVPVTATMAEATTAFALPFGETGVEKPFGMTLAYRDLVLDDAIWGLFDPTGQLPRDPATLVVDMDGTAVMDVDMFGDPEAMAQLQGPPGELKALTLNEILLDIAGATLRGTGDLTFPTPDPSAPVGTVDLALDGGFALIDKIVALGFIPAEQAAFVKGMAGAVAEQTGEDQLESTIEFTEGGGISANGMPLK